jgi:hypothetical protein
MPNPPHAGQVNPALLERLGRIAYHWAYVERLEADFLAFLLQANPAFLHVVSQNVSGSTITGWLRTLSLVRFTDAQTHDGLRILFGRIDDARAARNALVHGLWRPGSEPRTATVTTIKVDRAEIVKWELVTLDDLDSQIGEIGEIYAELITLGSQLGFHQAPQRQP